MQVTREYGVGRAQLYDFVADPQNWAMYCNNLDGVDVYAGDRATVSYRILGRVLEVDAAVLDARPGRRFHIELRGSELPGATYDWKLEDAQVGTKATVTLEAEPVIEWFGVRVDRLTVPRALERDLTRSLENVEELIQLGIA